MCIFKLIRYGLIVFLLVVVGSINSYAGPKNSPYPPAPCMAGGSNISVAGDGKCSPNISGVIFGALYPAGQNLIGSGPDDVFVSDNLAEIYVPHSGKWGMRVRYCPAQQIGACTIKNSQITVDSVTMVNLNSTTPIYAQDGNWGGGKGPGTLPVSSTTCFTLYDEQQNEYKTTTSLVTIAMCGDAGDLPTTPSICSINNGAPLDVTFGELDRANIAAKASVDGATNVKKSVTVDCSGDATMTVKTSFQFTSVVFNGDTLVSTSNSKLGVGIFYHGSLVTPDSTFTDSMQMGSNSVSLEFAVARDSKANISDIPTGEFTASAIMVMTEQ